MEAGKYGLTCETSFVARGHEVVADAWLMWISWFGGTLCFVIIVFPPQMNAASSKYEPALPHFLPD